MLKEECHTQQIFVVVFVYIIHKVVFDVLFNFMHYLIVLSYL